MGIEALVGVICGVLTIISIVSIFIFKIIHKNIMEDVATMIDNKIDKYEEENEKVREERQKRYSQTIENIEKSLKIISENIDTLHNDINSYGTKITIHEGRLDRVEKDVERLNR